MMKRFTGIALFLAVGVVASVGSTITAESTDPHAYFNTPG
jgi:hypothetical protein